VPDIERVPPLLAANNLEVQAESGAQRPHVTVGGLHAPGDKGDPGRSPSRAPLAGVSLKVPIRAGEMASGY